MESEDETEEMLERDDGENVIFTGGGGDFVPFGILFLQNTMLNSKPINSHLECYV